jgi:hypothetical protein
MKTALMAAVVAAAAVSGASGRVAASDSSTGWLHVRVEEQGKNTRVRVNLPLTVVEAALKAAPETVSAHGKIHIGGRHGRHLTVSELREAWTQLKNAGDTDLVTVEEDDGDLVTVARRGDMVQVRVNERRDGDQVRVDVPTAVVDALLSAPGDELNVRAAMAELRKMRGGEIVSVKDKDSTVRIWIDDEVAQPEGGR